jgi:small subunit ribosomal protein S1
MEELLARSGGSIKTFQRNQVVQAKISDLNFRSITLDIGGKSEGLIIGSCFDEIKSFLKNLKKGDTVKALVIEPEGPDGYVRLSLRHFVANAIWNKLEQAKINNQEIEVIGKNVTENGVVVETQGGLVGFIPISQLGKAVLKDLESLVNSHFKVKVVEVNRDKNRVVLSERAVSEKADIELYNQAINHLKEGELYQGIVTQVTNFGAFVEIKVKLGKKTIPIEGLVHVSELSWEKIDDPHTVISEGEKVEVKVIEHRDNKLSLSIKNAIKDPWVNIEEKYSPEQHIKCKIIRKSGFGIFVELEPGVEGLVHMTKIPPSTDLKKGQEVECYIEDINSKEKKISLGLVLTAKPVGYK